MEKYINTISLDLDKKRVNDFLSSQYIKLIDENNIIDNLLLLNEEPPNERFSILPNYSAQKETVQMRINEDSPLTKASGGLSCGNNTSFLSQDSAINTKGRTKTISTKSPPKISSDKVVFIKTQLKNEVANFTGYGNFIINV
jgi:hypothetical protein